jgi:molecular chaperone GrpE
MNIEIKSRASAPNVSDDSAAEMAPVAPSDAVQLADLELELSQMRDNWIRSEAEIANVRARARRDVDEARQFAVQKFATDVVEAAENLHRGVASLPPRSLHETDMISRLRDGFSGIERSFVALLERNGIKRQDPTGCAYDAEGHQAMDEQQTASHPPGTVLQAWSSAWILNGRLLRPAMVVVATAPHSHPTQSAPGDHP